MPRPRKVEAKAVEVKISLPWLSLRPSVGAALASPPVLIDQQR